MSSTGLLFAVAASLSWGILYVVDQKLLEGSTATGLLLLQSLVAVMLLILIRLAQRQPVIDLTPLKAQPALLGLSLLLTVAANVFILISIKQLNASFASVIEITYPLFIVLISWLLFRTVPSAWFLAGATLIFAGSTMILAHR